MIRFRLKELIAEKEFQEKRRITLEEISKRTGIHRTTLSKISNNRSSDPESEQGYNTTTDVLNKLCEYFEVEIGNVAEYVKNK